MNAGVPTMLPASVSGALSGQESTPVGAEDQLLEELELELALASSASEGGGAGTGLALPDVESPSRVTRPKSVTSTRPFLFMSRLVGLKSRWTSPAAWAAARPRPASRKTRWTSRQLRDPLLSQSPTVPPSTSSIAR